MTTTIERITELVCPILDDLGLELYDLEYIGGVVRITIDRPGGVDLLAITDVTRMVSREFDHVDPIESAYSIEVSSPGLERPLRTEEHFRRAVDQTITVKLLPNADGERRVEGLLLSVADGRIELRTPSGLRTLALSDVDKARTVFVWGPQPKPGGPKKAKGSVGAVTAAVATVDGDELLDEQLLDDELGDEFDDEEFDDGLGDDEFDDDGLDDVDDDLMNEEDEA